MWQTLSEAPKCNVCEVTHYDFCDGEIMIYIGSDGRVYSRTSVPLYVGWAVLHPDGWRVAE